VGRRETLASRANIVFCKPPSSLIPFAMKLNQRKITRLMRREQMSEHNARLLSLSSTFYMDCQLPVSYYIYSH
jgi:hypothetical protein